MTINVDVKLTDGVSGPAKSAGGAVTHLADQLGALGRGFGGTDSQLGRMASKLSAFRSQAVAAAESAQALARANEALTRMNNQSFLSRNEGLQKAVNTAMQARQAAGKLLMDPVKEFAAAHREKTALNKLRSAQGDDAGWLSKIMRAGAQTPTMASGKRGPESLFGKAVQWTGEKLGAGAAENLMGLGGALSKADGALQSVGLSLGGVLTAGAAAAAGAIMAIVAAITAVTVAIGAMAVKGTIAFAQMTIQVGQFREDSLLAFETMLKSGTLAQKVYDSAVKLAAKTPLETKDVISGYQKLLAGGYKENELEKIMMSISDFTSALGPEKLDQVVRAFARIKSEGKMSGEAVESLRDAGLPMEDLMKALGKTKMEDIYGTEAAKALPALLDVIQNRFGGLSEKRSKAMSGLISTLASRPFELFNEALKKAGGGLSTYYEMLKSGVDWMGKLLDPSSASGMRIVGLIDKLGMAFATMFKLDEKGFAGVFDQVLSVVETIMPYLTAFMGGFGEGFQAALVPLGALLRQITGKGDTISALAEGFRYLGIAVGFVVGMVVPLAVGFAGAIAAAVAFVAGLVPMIGLILSPLTALASALWDIGKSIVGAITGAFTGAFDEVTAAASKLGADAAQAFTAAFTPSISGDFMGGLGAMLPGVVPSGGYGLGGPTVPPQTFNWGSAPAPNQQNTTNNSSVFNVNLSGIGLDLAQLAALIRSEVTTAMKEATGT